MTSVPLSDQAVFSFGTPAPLTRDVIKLGQVDHVMDTRRMKAELLTQLVYPSVQLGLAHL